MRECVCVCVNIYYCMCVAMFEITNNRMRYNTVNDLELDTNRDEKIGRDIERDV